MLAGLIAVPGTVAATAASAAAPSASGPAPTGPAATRSGTLRLRPCRQEGLDGVHCGTIRVPIDHARPRGATTTLRLAIRYADRPDRRIGPLLLNNGNGGSAIEQLRLALVTGGVRGALAERFDLVAVDPRGVGQSLPIRCRRPQRRPGVTYFPHSRRAFRVLVRDNRALAAACRRRTPAAAFAHLDLRTAAHDLDVVRRALRSRRVTFYGIQSSALVARTYARLFPRRLRDVVLDTVVDDSLPVAQRLAGEVVAVETGLARFAAWCATAEDCALRGQDVLRVFEALRARAAREPIPVRGGPPLTSEDLGRAAQEQLVFRIAWPGFAAALRQAVDGDATALAVSADGTYDALQGCEAMTARRCCCSRSAS